MNARLCKLPILIVVSAVILTVTRTWFKYYVEESEHHLNSMQYLDLNRKPTVFTEPLEWHYINMLWAGRLGNLMFQFASMVGIAKKIGYTPVIPSTNELCRMFDTPYISDRTLENVQRVTTTYAAVFESQVYSLSKTSNWTLVGGLQSWRYFIEVPWLVKECFKIKTTILNKAENVLKKIRLKNETVIGVHVRRGDMASKRLVSLGFGTAPVSYLKKAMDYFREKYSNILFIVVSNDVKWCSENMNNTDVRITDKNTPYVDLALLSICNHTIITCGSFGWWGAWLAGGETIYFNGFPIPGSEISMYYNRTDYYPRHWIPML